MYAKVHGLMYQPGINTTDKKTNFIVLHTASVKMVIQSMILIHSDLHLCATFADK